MYFERYYVCQCHEGLFDLGGIRREFHRIVAAVFPPIMQFYGPPIFTDKFDYLIRIPQWQTQSSRLPCMLIAPVVRLDCCFILRRIGIKQTIVQMEITPVRSVNAISPAFRQIIRLTTEIFGCWHVGRKQKIHFPKTITLRITRRIEAFQFAQSANDIGTHFEIDDFLYGREGTGVVHSNRFQRSSILLDIGGEIISPIKQPSLSSWFTRLAYFIRVPERQPSITHADGMFIAIIVERFEKKTN